MKRIILLTLTAMLATSAASTRTAPPALNWMAAPPGLPAGAQVAVVSGDPGKKGMFTLRARLPGNYVVPPHWHPTDEKVSVISGRMAYGLNDRFNRVTALTLGPGETVVMKARMHHWVFAGDPTEIEVSAMGPFAITYVNPADDPRNVGRAERGR